MTTRGYPIELNNEADGSWTAWVEDLPGCVAAGATPNEAIEAVSDAIAAWIDTARSQNREVPLPSAAPDEYSGRFLVRLPRSVHRAAARRAAREGVSLNTYCMTAITAAVTRGLAADSPSGTARYVYSTSEHVGWQPITAGQTIHVRLGDRTVTWHKVSNALEREQPATSEGVLRPSDVFKVPEQLA